MRKFLAGSALVGLSLLVLGLWGSPPAPAAVSDTIDALTEKTLGAKDAPITVMEFASLTCPHCADFHEEVFPDLKREYIDTGKVRFIYRDFPLDQYALKASMLARCAGNDRYFAFLKVLFKMQESWATSGNPIVSLQRIARLGGLSPEDFKLCLNNKGLEDGLLALTLKYDKEFGIEETPTILINGKKFEGKHSFEALDKELRKLLPDS